MNIIDATSVIISVALLTIGLKGLVGKKAFLFNSKWIWLSMLLSFGPSQVFQTFCLLTDDKPFDLIFALLPLMLIVIISIVWRQMSGYMAIGITDDSIRAALHSALAARSINYEERLGRIHLKEQDADLEVFVQGYMGTGLMRVVKGANKIVLSEIASEMNEFFRESKVSVNHSTCYSYIVLGIMMLVMPIYLWFK